MRTKLLLLGALSLFALPACSALGLDNLPQSNCVQGSGGLSGDDYCASLAMRVPPPACHTWQCNEHSTHCEILPVDDDRDGYSSMMCAAPGEMPDCDDADRNNHPEGTETCNGRDQNCDGVADEGEVIPMMAMDTSLSTLASAMQFSLGYQLDADQAFMIARDPGFTAFSVTSTGTASSNAVMFSQMGMGTIMPLPTVDAAVAPLGTGRFAVVVGRMTTCRQWELFPVAADTGTATLRTTDESLLPACPGSGTQPLSAPALASQPNSNGHTLLLAWLAGTGTRACGSASPLAVTLSGATFDPRAAAINHVGAATQTLGMSVDNGPPALVALDDAFLVAYARADMTIAVHLATVDPLTRVVTVSTTPDYVEPAGTMTPQGVGLAVGSTATSGTSVALSYYTGCGGMNPITVRLLNRLGNTLTASSTAATGIGTGLARSLVQVAYQPRAHEWVVGWRSASGVGVQRLFEDGATEGNAFDIVTSSTVSAFLLEPLTTDSLYRAIVVNGTSLDQVAFGCATPP